MSDFDDAPPLYATTRRRKGSSSQGMLGKVNSVDGAYATVDVRGTTYTRVRIPHHARAIQSGDMVGVASTGGGWEITKVHTTRQPPEVSGSMGTKPSSATSAGGNISTLTSRSYTTISAPPSAPSDPSGNSNSQLYSKLTDVTAHLRRVQSWERDSVRDRLNALTTDVNNIRAAVNNHATRMEDMQDAINTNATRLNQTRDYAGRAGDLVEPITDALRAERIVR